MSDNNLKEESTLGNHLRLLKSLLKTRVETQCIVCNKIHGTVESQEHLQSVENYITEQNVYQEKFFAGNKIEE